MRSPDQVVPVIVLLGAVVLVGVLVRAARNRFRTGPAPDRIHCPKCGEVVLEAQVRPSPVRAIPDGYTCKACGQSMDGRGRAHAR